MRDQAKGSKIPNFLIISQNLSSFDALVNMSVNYFSVFIYLSVASLFWICFFIKWCLISIYFDLKCWIGFLVKLMALVLSHLMEMSLNSISKSMSCCLIHRIWAQQLSAIYSTSIVDNTIKFCFLLNQEIKLTSKNWQVPLVLFLSNLHPAKSASE